GVHLGLAALVALQTALHGMDLSMLRGPGPGLGAIVLAGALIWLLRSGSAGQSSLARGSGDRLPGWGLAALGPFLVLQLTLLVNVGRVQVQAGWELPAASLVILLGLAAAVAVQGWSWPYPVRLAAAGLAVALLAQPDLIRGAGVLLLIPLQAALGVTMASALASPAAGSTTGAGRHAAGVYAWTVVGAGALLALVFLFYQTYEWQGLWPILAGLIALPALVPGPGAATMDAAPSSATARFRTLGAHGRRAVLAVLIIGAAGLTTGQVVRGAPPATVPAPAELVVLSYNIHHGFDTFGVPGPEAIARVIERIGADIVGLQEVGRGWNVNSGVDLMAWLRWRLPQYHAVYGPMNGDLWGNAILSKYPIAAWGWVHYPIRLSPFERGLTWAEIPTVRGNVLVVTTHFSAHPGHEPDRLGQAGDLLAFWDERPRSIIVGDINARPYEDPVRRLIDAGLVDVPAAHGLGETFTARSHRLSERIDYIFTSPDIGSISAVVPHTLASDHLPVVATVRLD
ncbi:MAG TPA: endonuclease/exonuclease/phosphatase family protein, partial [Patescibacteria group bacterium]|nr:endonuclease/exonuclease/phosphatase family protein [Patescibacteria group bacterium]